MRFDLEYEPVGHGHRLAHDTGWCHAQSRATINDVFNPRDALKNIAPKTPEKRSGVRFYGPRNPANFSKESARRAGLPGFGRTRFHDLRGIHATALLDAGIPVHTLAHRLGDDPAVLLRNYTKRKRTGMADDNLATAIGAFAAGFLGSK